jgi:hypothetical protein
MSLVLDNIGLKAGQATLIRRMAALDRPAGGLCRWTAKMQSALSPLGED